MTFRRLLGIVLTVCLAISGCASTGAVRVTPTSGTKEAAAVLAGGAALGTVAGAQEHRRSETAYLDRYVAGLSARGYRTTP